MKIRREIACEMSDRTDRIETKCSRILIRHIAFPKTIDLISMSFCQSVVLLYAQSAVGLSNQKYKNNISMQTGTPV
jgi:hypothetical protein